MLREHEFYVTDGISNWNQPIRVGFLKYYLIIIIIKEEDTLVQVDVVRRSDHLSSNKISMIYLLDSQTRSPWGSLD